MMGAYWAYETLNFGGYWNWDPVENAVYIPWLVLVASLHGMMLWQQQPHGPAHLVCRWSSPRSCSFCTLPS